MATWASSAEDTRFRGRPISEKVGCHREETPEWEEIPWVSDEAEEGLISVLR